MGIQLAHAGRKCEVKEEEIISPSPIAFSKDYKVPMEMNRDTIKEVVEAFQNAAKRSLEIGYDILELHGAHGYLIN